MLQLVSVALFVTVSWFFRNQSPELQRKRDRRGEGGDAEEQDRDRAHGCENGDDSQLQLSGKCLKRTRRRWWWSRQNAQSRKPALILNPVVALALQETTRVVNSRSRNSRGGGLGVIVVTLDGGGIPLRSSRGNDAATIGRRPETLRIDRLLVKRFVVPTLGLWERGVFVHPTAVVESLRDLGDGATVWHFCHVSRRSCRQNLCCNTYIDICVEIVMRI